MFCVLHNGVISVIIKSYMMFTPVPIELIGEIKKNDSIPAFIKGKV